MELEKLKAALIKRVQKITAQLAEELKPIEHVSEKAKALAEILSKQCENAQRLKRCLEIVIGERIPTECQNYTQQLGQCVVLLANRNNMSYQLGSPILSTYNGNFGLQTSGGWKYGNSVTNIKTEIRVATDAEIKDVVEKYLHYILSDRILDRSPYLDEDEEEEDDEN